VLLLKKFSIGIFMAGGTATAKKLYIPKLNTLELPERTFGHLAKLSIEAIFGIYRKGNGGLDGRWQIQP
jgi:hypothetical protein